MLQKRYAQVSSWLEHVQDDGRVHGRVTTNGAVTGRMTHQTPNMAQVPSVTHCTVRSAEVAGLYLRIVSWLVLMPVD